MRRLFLHGTLRSVSRTIGFATPALAAAINFDHFHTIIALHATGLQLCLTTCLLYIFSQNVPLFIMQSMKHRIMERLVFARNIFFAMELYWHIHRYIYVTSEVKEILQLKIRRKPKITRLRCRLHFQENRNWRLAK